MSLRTVAAVVMPLLLGAGGVSLMMGQEETHLPEPDLEASVTAIAGESSAHSIAVAQALAAPTQATPNPTAIAPALAAPAPQTDLESMDPPAASVALTEPEPIATAPTVTASIPQSNSEPQPSLAAAAPEVGKAPFPVPGKILEQEAAPAAPEPRVPVTITAMEIEAYLAKAERALSSGDLAVARSFFARVFNGGDARGALGMARTYDEEVLKKLPVFGQKPNKAEADRWNEIAQQRGASASAPVN
ncbi:hypothetical protein [Microvirga roseola]|uniref:hypothetical protein n=1 Tax=Microvirga roseola TaxID=2883126 RepID=UPI001E4B3503|nr:hypothetical protein [Microvirga roseola]